MTTHGDHHYSITVRTDDLAILHCLRALADYAQQTGNKRIAWGGTKEADWAAAGHQVTFHLSSPDYRSTFLAQAIRLLPGDLWEEVSEDDNDPATPQS